MALLRKDHPRPICGGLHGHERSAMIADKGGAELPPPSASPWALHDRRPPSRPPIPPGRNCVCSRVARSPADRYPCSFRLSFIVNMFLKEFVRAGRAPYTRMSFAGRIALRRSRPPLRITAPRTVSFVSGEASTGFLAGLSGAALSGPFQVSRLGGPHSHSQLPPPASEMAFRRSLSFSVCRAGRGDHADGFFFQCWPGPWPSWRRLYDV